MKKTLILVLSLFTIMIISQSCGSRALNNAKTFINNGKYKEAVEELNKDIIENEKAGTKVTNAEYYILLTDSYIQLKDYENAAKNMIKAKELNTDPKLNEKISFQANNIWVTVYNKGIESLNKFSSSKSQADFDESMKNFNVGLSIRPEILSFYRFIGSLYEIAEKKDKANEVYNDYCNKFMATFNAIKNYKVSLLNDRNNILSAINMQPKTDNILLDNKQDSLKIDHFDINGKELILFSKLTYGQNVYKVISWSYDLPKHWLPNERNQFFDIDLYPFQILAQNYYNLGKKEDALKVIKNIIEIDPTNTEYLQSYNALLAETGKIDDAINSIKEILAKNPNDKEALRQYGDLLSNADNPVEAIAQYEKALAIDPNFDAVNRNIASAFKNKAAKNQRKEQDKLDADKKYKVNFDAYIPDLKTSAQYFEKVLKTKTYKNDFTVMGELINIYIVLGEKAKTAVILSDLEKLEDSIVPEQKLSYYYILLKGFGDVGNSDKLNLIKSKIDNFKK